MKATAIRLLLPLLLPLLMVACSERTPPAQEEYLEINQEKATYLYQFAYACIDKEYPHKTGLVWGDESYLAPPREQHPAFYGCFDWHSAVHGHWTLVTILSHLPDFEHREAIIEKLQTNLTAENIRQEIRILEDDHNRTFQRTYGWAWLLKLDEALREWEDPVAIPLRDHLRPLSDLIAGYFVEFLDVLNHPIRVGEHPNTAFGMSFAYDFAQKYHPELAAKIEEKAMEFFYEDRACPLDWEPGGFDFLSPCLQQASLMLKVLPTADFGRWLGRFLPGFERQPSRYLIPADVADPTDGKLAHLDGLNFSRAWCLFEMGHALNNPKLYRLGLDHFQYSYEQLDTEEYMGSHWLASFATQAILKSRPPVH